MPRTPKLEPYSPREILEILSAPMCILFQTAISCRNKSPHDKGQLMKMWKWPFRNGVTGSMGQINLKHSRNAYRLNSCLFFSLLNSTLSMAPAQMTPNQTLYLSNMLVQKMQKRENWRTSIFFPLWHIFWSHNLTWTAYIRNAGGNAQFGVLVF